ncbi:MAG: hypothetical protein ACYS74_21690, partial [Planctomycetota bacterium]
HLSSEPPREAFKQQALRDSTAEFIRVCRRRSAWRRAQIAAAAVLIASVAFFGGRLSAPRTLVRSMDAAPWAADEPDGVKVPSDLVAWLEAARLFRQLGMEDRMARAVERAGRLLPVDIVVADGEAVRVFAANRSAENQRENQREPVELTDMQGPHPSAESINQILAQSFGD